MNPDEIAHHAPSIKTLNDWLSCEHFETEHKYNYIIHNLLEAVLQIMHKKNATIKDMNELRIDVCKHIYRRWSKYQERTH